jgi:hypothetical protein
VTDEGTDGSENDVPYVDIFFCTGPDRDTAIHTVRLNKSDTSVSGPVTLSSGASIPANTRDIFIYLHGTSTSGDNTVVFSNPSMKIHDAAAPSCTVTISAADGDSGLEGIYYNGAKVAATSPYTFEVSENGTHFTAYSKDYAGKTSSESDITIANIDVNVPDAPASVPLSHDGWSSADVALQMPELSWDSAAAPEFYICRVNGGEWQTLPDGYAFTENGTYSVSVAVSDEAGNVSASADTTVYIDKTAPVINGVSQTSASGSCTVGVDYTDGGGSGIAVARYAEGEQDAAFFDAGGTDFSGGTFTVASGGTYTIYLADGAGNYALRTASLSTAPVLGDIADVSIDEDEALHIILDVSDAETALENLTIEASASDEELLAQVTVQQSAGEASLDITPVADRFGGPVTVTVTVTDEAGESAGDTFAVTVIPVNDAPLAVDDAGYVADEDSEIRIDVLANDSDPADGDELSIDSVSEPSHGTAVAVLGQIKYTPAENYAGADEFSYTAADGNGGTATAMVSITVNNVNDAPYAADDEAAVTEDGSVLIDVLANDTDIDTEVSTGEAITLTGCENGLHGSAVLENGQVRYTPDGDFNGDDTFIYAIQDAAGATAEASVTVRVAAAPDAPYFVNLPAEITIDEDSRNAPLTFEIHDVETPADSMRLRRTRDCFRRPGLRLPASATIPPKCRCCSARRRTSAGTSRWCCLSAMGLRPFSKRSRYISSISTTCLWPKTIR